MNNSICKCNALLGVTAETRHYPGSAECMNNQLKKLHKTINELQKNVSNIKTYIRKLRSENERLKKLLTCCECRHVGYDNNRAICYYTMCDNYQESCPLVYERQSDENKNQNTNNTGYYNDRSNVPK